MTTLKSEQITHNSTPLGNVLDSKIQALVDFSSIYDPAAISPNTAISQEFTVTGALLGDFAVCSFNQSLAGLQMTSYVNASNKVTVVLFNPTAGTINLASGTLKIRITRSA